MYFKYRSYRKRCTARGILPRFLIWRAIFGAVFKNTYRAQAFRVEFDRIARKFLRCNCSHAHRGETPFCQAFCGLGLRLSACGINPRAADRAKIWQNRPWLARDDLQHRLVASHGHVSILNFGFFKICRCWSLLISRGARRKILRFQHRPPVLKFYVTPMKGNFFMPLGGALKFKIAPLKGRFLRRLLLRKFLIPMPRMPF